MENISNNSLVNIIINKLIFLYLEGNLSFQFLSPSLYKNHYSNLKKSFVEIISYALKF